MSSSKKSHAPAHHKAETTKETAPKKAEETTEQSQDAGIAETIQENTERRGPSLSETVQSAASAAGTPAADALAAAEGKLVVNTPEGQATVDPAGATATATKPVTDEKIEGEGTE